MTVVRFTYPCALWYFIYLAYNILSNIESFNLKKCEFKDNFNYGLISQIMSQSSEILKDPFRTTELMSPSVHPETMYQGPPFNDLSTTSKNDFFLTCICIYELMVTIYFFSNHPRIIPIALWWYFVCENGTRRKTSILGAMSNESFWLI